MQQLMQPCTSPLVGREAPRPGCIGCTGNSSAKIAHVPMRRRGSPFLAGSRALQVAAAHSVARRRAAAAPARALRNIDQPEALLFDCDGVLVDTEKDGHRVTFNEAFKRKGIDHQWGVDLYGKLLEVGGGKERMMHYFDGCADREPWASMPDAEQRKEFVKGLHLLKTDIFMEFVETGAMPLRPGVKRLVEEAIANGVQVAVCSTSNERAVSTIVRVMLGPEVASRMRVFAGDMVDKKKPDPAIYLMAAKELGVEPHRCVVVEDSRIGLQAAKAAGMRCVVTKSSYTQNEDFAMADAVFDCIGEAGDERFSLDDLTTPGMQALAARAGAGAAAAP